MSGCRFSAICNKLTISIARRREGIGGREESALAVDPVQVSADLGMFQDSQATFA